MLTLDQIESGTGNIINKNYLPAKDASVSSQTFDEGNVLYSKLRPYLNKVFLPNESGYATTELVPLRPNEKILDRKFLYYFLRSAPFLAFASQNVAGIKMPRVIMEKFWEYPIQLPALSEQSHIVEILDQADALRKKRAEADKIAQKILPALFYSMFGDLRSNPNNLKKEKLEKLIKVKSGESVPVKSLDNEKGFPVYGGNGINGYHTEYMFEDPVIVIGRVGIYCGSVYYAESRSWVTDNALYVAEKSADLQDQYLTEALRLANLNQYAGRAGQPLISGNRIYPIEILVPPIDLQNSFGNRAANLAKLLRSSK